MAHWQVVLGLIVGVSVLTAISLSTALAALAFSPSYVGLLGFAPIVLGVLKFRALLIRRRAVYSPAERRSRATSGGAPGVALVTIASGADNIGGLHALFRGANTGAKRDRHFCFRRDDYRVVHCCAVGGCSSRDRRVSPKRWADRCAGRAHRSRRVHTLRLRCRNPSRAVRPMISAAIHICAPQQLAFRF